MTYQEFMTAFSQRLPAALDGLRTSLIAAGVAANRITVEEVTSEESVPDLRFRITAIRGSRTLICYAEVTSGAIIDGHMAIIITLWCEGNGNQITTTYIPNAPAKFSDGAQMDALLGRITAMESACTGELLTAARAFLQV